MVSNYLFCNFNRVNIYFYLVSFAIIVWRVGHPVDQTFGEPCSLRSEVEIQMLLLLLFLWKISKPDIYFMINQNKYFPKTTHLPKITILNEKTKQNIKVEA